MKIDIVPILLGTLSLLGTIFGTLIIWGIQKWIKATFQNTVAIELLNNTIKTIVERTDKVPEIEKDLNQAHYKIRTIENGLRKRNGVAAHEGD